MTSTRYAHAGSWLGVLLALALVAMPAVAAANPPTDWPRLGVLPPSTDAARTAAVLACAPEAGCGDEQSRGREMIRHFIAAVSENQPARARPADRAMPISLARAAACTAALFDGRWVRADAAVEVECAQPIRAWVLQDRTTGLILLALWLTGDAEAAAATVTLEGVDLQEPVSVDLRDGSVRAVPARHHPTTPGLVMLRDLPVTGAPLVIVERRALPR